MPSTKSEFYVYRFEPSAFVGYSEDFQMIKEIPFSFPVQCGLFDTFPAPHGQFLAVELSCPNDQSVLFLETGTGTFTQPFTDSDSHFLAWTNGGDAAYLRIDSLGSPQIIRASTDGSEEFVPVTEFTYDLAPSANKRGEFTFTFSRGLGYGSELHIAKNDGRITQLLFADLYNYISYARFSPDGQQIAFIKTPDSQTPFTVGELWVIPSKVTYANKTPSSMEAGRLLAYVDAGHGYAANWSPDGKKIAFVVRENPEDENADHSSDDLISNIYIVDVESGVKTQITNFIEGRAETPHWSPSGNTLAFNVVLNGRMQVHIADINFAVRPSDTGMETKHLEADIAPVGGSTCCPAWLRK